LEFLKEEPYENSISARKKTILGITLPKGLIASLVLRKDIRSLPEEIQGWIKWQSKFGIDFSEANLSWNYFVATSFLAVSEFPELYSRLPHPERLQETFLKTEELTQKFHREIFLKAYDAKRKNDKNTQHLSEKKNDDVAQSFKNLFGEDVFDQKELTEKDLRDRLVGSVLSSRSKGYSRKKQRRISSKIFLIF